MAGGCNQFFSLRCCVFLCTAKCCFLNSVLPPDRDDGRPPSLSCRRRAKNYEHHRPRQRRVQRPGGNNTIITLVDCVHPEHVGRDKKWRKIELHLTCRPSSSFRIFFACVLEGFGAGHGSGLLSDHAALASWFPPNSRRNLLDIREYNKTMPS